jgi:peptide/nickel transport system substrate-binding protein
MKKLRWPFLIVLLALAAIALLLFSKQTAVLLPVPEEVKPAAGGEYIEGLIGAPGRFNPVLDFYNSVDRDLDRLLFSGLVRFDDRGLPQGDLAESWGITPNGEIYNFSIRPDAVWHDGEPVTSDDVIFTVELLRDKASITPADIRELWKDVQVKRLNEKTIQFRLPEPYAPFMDYLSFGVLPSHLLKGLTYQELMDAPFNLAPVGSGPYRFNRLLVEGDRITGVVLQAFDDYYRQRPFIDRIVFRYYDTGASALLAYQEGQSMGISQVTPDILPAVLNEDQLQLYSGRLPLLSLVFFNLDNPQVPFFTDPLVRRALLTGLNRQWIVDHLLDGQAIVADSPIFPNTWAYYDGIDKISYDPDEATALLKEAGYTIPAEGGSVRTSEDGVRLEFELLYPDDDRHTSLAETIQKDWQRLGVNVNLKPLPYDQLVETQLAPRLYQAALVDLNLARAPDPDPYPFWHQAQATGGQNYSKWDDRQASEYLEQARVIVDIAERTRSYHNFQVRFSQELPALPLFYPVYNYAVDADVQGVTMGPLFDPSDRFSTVTNWYLLAGPSAETTLTPSATP